MSYFPNFLSDLFQISTDLFEILYSFYCLYLNLDRVCGSSITFFFLTLMSVLYDDVQIDQ